MSKDARSGAAAAPGANGAPGEIRIVTCKKVRKHGRVRKVTQRKCTTTVQRTAPTPA
ncbi:hypothetical protein [Solirubrobacter soli]|uniref:hypothetical protein n=1 Tax=Solirubrobacter soli TaxID=363832 RepID=UPI0004159FEE|nr:hypothetical protein [Solirubrobacter soli]